HRTGCRCQVPIENFTLAAREFIQRHNNIELLKQINDAYEDASDPDPMVTIMRANHSEMVKDQW
ncbi:MAG: hypothetical protein ABR534_15860, partial [Desulfotignum sp.]